MKAKPIYLLAVPTVEPFRQRGQSVLAGVLQLLICGGLILGGLNAFSQGESPYSQYGLGTLSSTSFSANRGMGFLAAPYASAVNINYTNPASYASLTRTTLEIGANINGSRLITRDSSYGVGGGSVSHFVLAFVPNAKHNAWAVSVGILPYSNVDYNFVQNFKDTAIGPYSEQYTGSGSLYQVYVGGAYKVKGFSIGANLGYLFGKVEYQDNVIFPDSAYAYNTQTVTDVNIHGFLYNVGVQYQKLIYHNRDDPDARRDIYVTFGAYGSSGATLRTKSSVFTERSYTNLNTTDSSLSVLDTLQSALTQKGSIKIPFNLGAGVMFGNEMFWMAGIDFKYANWQNYTTTLGNGGLNNSWQVSFGTQVTPKYDANSYLKRIQYRLGAYYGQSEINYAGNHLTQGGATFGLGFPFQSVAHLNVTSDFGSVGSNSLDVIKQNYYRFTIGLVINQIWFLKPKFD